MGNPIDEEFLKFITNLIGIDVKEDLILHGRINEDGKLEIITDNRDQLRSQNLYENPNELHEKSLARFKSVEEYDKHWNAIHFHIDAIEAEDDVDVIETHIEAIEILEPFYQVRRDIRYGLGCLKKIQQKCINLNLV